MLNLHVKLPAIFVIWREKNKIEQKTEPGRMASTQIKQVNQEKSMANGKRGFTSLN